MLAVTKIELGKLFKSKSYIATIIALIIFTVIAVLLMFYNREGKVNLLSLVYNLFALNSDIFFPAVTIAFFSSLITREFQGNTLKLLIGSVHNRSNLILGKFLAGALTFSIIFLTIIIVTFGVALLLPIKEASYLDYEGITIVNTFGRTLLVAVSTTIYLISFGGLSFLIALLSKSQSITMLSSIGLLVFYLLIPVPMWLTDYIFIGKGAAIYTSISFLEIPYLAIGKTILVCLLYLFLFLAISIFYFRKYEFK